MRSAIVSLVAVAGLSVAAHGQAVMRMLVSTDGVTFSNSVNANPGQHVDVLVTVSYTGAGATTAGFGSANFQPIVSNWDNAGAGASIDRLSPILQGGNTQGQMVNPQASAVGAGTPNPYLTPTSSAGGTPVPAGPYGAGTYGRVYPMGRTFLDGPNAITSFVHTNPGTDPTGRSYAPGTYLRIAQANNPNWFNTADNVSGGSGVNAAQLYTNGRTTNDPNFWGASDMTYDPGDPPNGINPSYTSSNNGQLQKRQNVQVFRFGIDLSADTDLRTLLVDAPLAGQQVSSGTNRYIGFFLQAQTAAQPNQNILFGTGAAQSRVESASINIVPTPATMALLGLGGLVIGRRRRA